MVDWFVGRLAIFESSATMAHNLEHNAQLVAAERRVRWASFVLNLSSSECKYYVITHINMPLLLFALYPLIGIGISN